MRLAGTVCQLNYDGGGCLQYTEDGKSLYIRFLQAKSLQVGQKVTFATKNEEAVDVEPSNLQVPLQRETADLSMREKRVMPQDRVLQKSNGASMSSAVYILIVSSDWSRHEL